MYMRLMKHIFIVISLFAVQSQAVANLATFRCFSAGQYKDDGYFNSSGQYGVLKMEEHSVTLEVYDKNGGGLGATYVYDLDKLMSGQSKVAGFMRANLNYQKSHYSGDGITSIYFEPSLQKGGKLLHSGKKGGLLTFTGHGYSWDWNLCSQ